MLDHLNMLSLFELSALKAPVSRRLPRVARVLAVAVVLLSLLAPPLNAAGVQTSASIPLLLSGPSPVGVLRSDLDRIVLELTAPSPVLGAGEGELSGYETVQAAGFEVSGEPGAPQLPVKGVPVGVPAGAEVELRLVEVVQEALPGSHRLAPAPAYGVEAPSPEQWQMQVAAGTLERTVSWEEDPAVYGVDAVYPDAPVWLAEMGQVRSQRLAVLGYYPVQANAVTGEVLYTSRVVVELVFRYPEGRDSLGGGIAIEEPETFERLLQGSLVNYETAREWRAPRGSLAVAVPAGLEATPDPGYKVVVRETGLYELSYDDLALAGLPVDTLDPATLQMYYHDEEMAITVAGEGDGSFDAEDYVLFHGEALSGKYLKYTDDNVYWLTYGQAYGSRMAEVDGTPGGVPGPTVFEDVVHFEVDTAYWSEMPGEGDDFSRWYWDWATAPGSTIHPAALADVAPVTVTDPLAASIRVAMAGYTDLPPDPDQHVVVWVNGHNVGEFEWDGVTLYVAEFEFDQGFLHEGTGDNTVEFEALLNEGVAYSYPTLDWFEIGYQRVYLADGDALAHGSDVSGDIEIDGFTAAPPGGMEDLTSFDVTQPLTVKRVLNSVWEESEPGVYRVRFGDTAVGAQEYWTGLPGARLSPVSIELDSPSDLRWTGNSAEYVIISHADFVGEMVPLRDCYNGEGLGTVLVDVQDVYDEFSGGVFYPGAIRDFLAYAYEYWQGNAPIYVLLVGDGHWDFKYLDSDTDVNQYIPPYLAYVDSVLGETAADNRYVAIVGDDIFPDMHLGRFPVNTPEEAGVMVSKSLDYQQAPAPGDWNTSLLFVADNPDTGGDFYDLSDEIAADYVPESYAVTKVYHGTASYPTAGDTKAGILGAISEGQLLVSYIGHSAVTWWAEERFFQAGDVPGLTNGEKLPIMLPMTCTEGLYAAPYNRAQALSEVMVRAAGGGAVASFAPTGWGAALGHHYLQKGFYDAVFAQGVRRVGDATTAAKLRLWTDAPSGGYRDLIDTYGLLGDPAASLPIPPTGVDLLSFTAMGAADAIVLNWETASEPDNLGFNLYRAESLEGEQTKLNEALIPTLAPPGTNEGGLYEHTDGDVVPGITYYYWLEDADIYGGTGLHGPVEAQVTVPTLHVADLDGVKSSENRSFWRAGVTTLIVDGSGNPMAEATVTGDWSGGTSGTSSCLTDSFGLCTATSDRVPGSQPSVTFTVTGVGHASLVYDAGQNVDPDGDSDGTTIVVYRDGPPPNQLPIPSFTYTCADLACTFDGKGSYDPDGTIVSYDWDFGDGSTGAGVEITYEYGQSGTYTIVLTVTDDDGASDSESQTVSVGDVPLDEIYVYDIAMSGARNGSSRYASAVITIRDTAGNLVQGATVYGGWSDDYSASVQGTTTADGTVIFTSGNVRKASATFTFTVTGVIKAGFTYNPDLNVETSDSIVVR